jgi:RimJ/RimL family protein N-acetyltransferase
MAANIFRSERLVYRAIEDTDEDKAFIKALKSDTLGWYRYSSQLPKPPTKKAVDNYTEQIRSDEFLGVLACLPVTPKVNGTEGVDDESEALEPIGVVDLHRISPASMHHRCSDIGIIIASKYRGQGYGSEAIEWVLEWGFQMAGFHRVGICTYSYNVGAWKLYERLGFVLEGKTRECKWFNGGWHDYIILGMLESEWRVRKEQKKLESDAGSVSMDGWSDADLAVGEEKQ